MAEQRSQIVIGTAGHIDHGKTALVKALTGVDTDRLAEEKARGMTIDLGFAFLTDTITIIDVPGHERFIRNMVAGVSTIDLVLLVIAADDGIMPQTREHLNIVSLLGIPRGVIALTKIDLVDDPDWLDLVEEEIRETVSGTFLEQAPIIRTSVNPETGIEALRRALLEQADQVRHGRDRGFFRLSVDRVFLKTGFGVVVTGTVTSGRLTPGAEVLCLPAGVKAKVRGLQSHKQAVSEVIMGDRAAVNLAGVSRGQLWRGSELVTPGWMEPTRRLIARVKMISPTRWQLKSKQRVRLHIGTAEILGRVTVLDGPLREGETGNLILSLEKPVAAAMDDRFVLRSYSPQETIGGGQVLDPQPAGKWKELKQWARELAVDRVRRLRQFVDRDRQFPKNVADWTRVFQTTADDMEALIRANGLERIPGSGLVYHPDYLAAQMEAVQTVLARFHEANPYRPFLSSEALKQSVGFSGRWADFVLDTMQQQGRLQAVAAGYALAEHKVSLSAADQAKAERVLFQLKTTRYMPLKLAEIAAALKEDESIILKLLHVLKHQQRTVEIAPDLWLDRDRLEELIATLKQFFTRHDKLTVPDFKELTGQTRKTAIPLLEYLDAQGITERTGNDRVKGEALK
jgi:selenocysteine-specific elongation factor